MSIDQTLRVGEQGMWALHLASLGPDPLSWTLFEASADSTVGDVTWFVLQEDHAFTEPGVELTIPFRLDATGLAADSTYRANLLLASNSLDEDSLWLPVAFTVLPDTVEGFTGRVMIRNGRWWMTA